MADGQRGSVLLLFPAAVLIVLVLAAITVDSSIAFLAQRELANATAAAANDAAGLAVDSQAFYQGDRIELNPYAVEAVAVERVRLAIDQSRHRALDVRVTASPPAGPGCPWTVQVSASSRVPYVFAKALPGGPDEAVGAGDVGRRPRTEHNRRVRVGYDETSWSCIVRRADPATALPSAAKPSCWQRHPTRAWSSVRGVEGDADRPVLVTTLVPGPTLAAPLALTVEEVAGVAEALAATLADLHDMGIVHGAVTPEHVLVGPDGRPVLCGFGSAGRIGETAPGGDRELHPSADVAALGRLLRRLAIGPDARGLRRIAEATTVDDPAARPSARTMADELGDCSARGPAAGPAWEHRRRRGDRRAIAPGGSPRRPRAPRRKAGADGVEGRPRPRRRHSPPACLRYRCQPGRPAQGGGPAQVRGTAS